tara:strand:- start:675 stop:1817 length:1143 start_codon:yes stop_codon:yes gene_type:complete
MEYIKRKDNNFDGDISSYLKKVGASYGLTGRQYAIERLRAMGLLSKNNKFAENPEDKLALSDKDKKFLYLNANATKNLQLLNTTDDNRANEKAMLDELKNGNSVEYFEGKGLFSSLLDNLGSGQTIRTVEEVYNLAKNGKATNFGLYGFSAEELIAAVDSGAISLDADFNEDTQSLMAVELVRVQANKSNSIMGAVTEADKDWRRLSNLNEIEKAAVLRFFPSLRGMPMNQFHNLQQDIAEVYLDDIERITKTIQDRETVSEEGLFTPEYIKANPEFKFLDKGLSEQGVTTEIENNEAAIINQILKANTFVGKQHEERLITIRIFFENRIKEGKPVSEEIRRALQGTRNMYQGKELPLGLRLGLGNKLKYNDNFDYLQKK